MSFRRWLLLTSTVCVGLVLAAGSIWLLRRLAPTLWLFALGFLLAYVLDPLLDRLERRGLSRGQAVAAVMVVFVLVLGLLAVWIVPDLVFQIQHLVSKWPEYNAQIQRTYETVDNWARAYLNARYPDLDVMAFVDAKVAEVQTWAQSKVPELLGMVSDTLLRSLSLVGLSLMVVFIGLNFMLVIEPFRKTIRSLLPPRAGDGVAEIGHRVNRMLGQYVRGQATMCVIMGCLATAVLLILGRIFGTQYGLIIGVLAGVVYMVPWVGPFVTNVTAIIIGYVTAAHHPGVSALCAMGCITTINFLCDNIITPRVIGREVGLHPLVVIFALLCGFQVLGVPGMVIATPTAASIKIILARWLPIKEVEVKPGQPEPLVLDLHWALHRALKGVQDATRKVEGAMRLGGHSDHEPKP